MEPRTPPTDPVAQYQEALALHQAGRLDEAAATYRAMLAQFPGNPLLMAGLGTIALQQGDLNEGVRQLEAALRIEPEQPMALSNLGMALRSLNRLDEALERLDRAVALAPEFAEAHNHRGIVLRDLKRLDEALAACDRAAALNPGFAQAWNNRGVTLHELNRWPEALHSFDRALALNPRAADVHSNRARVLRDLGRLDDSLAACNAAIALDPGYGEAYINRGNALKDMGRQEEAMADFGRAIALMPDDAEAHCGMGYMLQRRNRYAEALASFDRAVALRPDFTEAWSNRGIVLKYLRRFDEALASQDRAIALDPQCAAAYWNAALVRLLLGDYAAGWPLYEWRWQSSEKNHLRTFPEPLWLGDRPISGKTVLIHAEQGYGDFIMCCRYIPMVEALGATVVVEVFPALALLVSTLKGNFTLVASGQPLPHFDLHCPVMSLPLAFKTTLETIPAEVPYLFAEPARVAAWRQRLGPKSRMRVGIAFSGNPAQQDNDNRSVQARLLAPLFDLPVDFHVLQKGFLPGDAAELARFANVYVHDDEIADFADTAALMSEMDLVISTCTSIANLAGAMGRPLWALLSYIADWRWLLECSDSPWYPTATLFRQRAIGEWDPVIAEVAARLGNFAQEVHALPGNNR